MNTNKQAGSPRFAGEAGQASRLLLILAIVVLVAAVITYLIIRMAEKPPVPTPAPGPVVQQPVYEQALGNIRFIFESGLDRGQILRASEIKNNQYSYQKQDFVISNAGAKFIQVVVGAKNMGTENTEQNAWNIGNIVDSEGRNFIPIEDYNVNAWLPNPNPCGAVLKPAFDPTPCTKIYEVSNKSTGLKIKIQTGKNNSSISSGSTISSLIDLIVK